jgi:tetratricopeptide (TPR) repeat protein
MMIEKLFPFLDKNPKGVALALFAVLAAGATGGGLVIKALDARNDAVKAQYEYQVSAMKQARVELESRLALFCNSAEDLLSLVDAVESAEQLEACETTLDGVRDHCEKIRSALAQAEIIQPIFKRLQGVFAEASFGDEASLYAVRGEIARSRGDLDRALLEFNEAVQLKPDQGLYLYQLGTTHMEAGNVEEAMAALERAAELTGTTGELDYQKGQSGD